MSRRAPSSLVTVAEAARMLGIGRSTLYASLKRGDCQLRPVVVCKQVRLPRMAVEDLIAGYRTPEPAPKLEETDRTRAAMLCYVSVSRITEDVGRRSPKM